MPSRRSYIPTQSPIIIPGGSGSGLVIRPTASPSGGARPGSAALGAAAQTQAEREMVVGGWGSVVPMVYGRVKLGGTIAVAKTFTGAIRAHVITVWSMGRCEGVNELYLDDGPASRLTGFGAYHYYGTATQTYPSGLHAAYPAYEDDLANIAYTYLTFGMAYNGKDPFKTAGADFSGRWLYDPRQAGHDEEDPETWTWSENPALALADWIWRDDGEGRGFDSLNWDSVAEAAEWTGATINDRPRHTIGLSIEQIRPVREWREVLRAYAHAILHQDGGKTVMVPDRPRSVDHYLTTDDIKPGSLQVFTKREEDLPNVVEVEFTDRDSDPENKWRSGLERATTGDETRSARYAMPGIVNRSEAYRETLERPNRGTLITRTCRLELFSQGEKVTPGDVIQIDDDNLPITAGLFRVLNKRRTGDRNWGLESEAYDENVYPNAVAAPSAYGSVDEPSPFEPPTVTGLTVTEELKTGLDGRVYTQIRAVWGDMTVEYPYVEHYEVEIPFFASREPKLVNEWTYGPAVDGTTYTVKVYIRSTVGRLSAAAVKSVIAKGKRVEPSRVPFMAGLGLVGAVHLRWEPAVDIGPLDYEIRVGSAGDSWDDAELVDRVKATYFFDPMVPAGTYRYFVKARDEYKNYSSGPDQYADVTVQDGNLARIADFHWTGADMINAQTMKMRFAKIRGRGWVGVPADGRSWADAWPGAAWTSRCAPGTPWMFPRPTFGGAAGTNDTILAVGLWNLGNLGAIKDVSCTLSGMTVELLKNGDNAAVGQGLQFNIGGSWIDQNSYHASGVTRYPRPYVRDLCDGPNAGFVISIPQAARMAVMKETVAESGVEAMTASNQPVSVAFTRDFSALADFEFGVEAATPGVLTACWHNLDPDGGDLYLYDAAGNHAVGNVAWKVSGP